MNLPNRNWLLAGLPEAGYARLRSRLEPVMLEKGETLYRAGEHTERVYFPLDCLVSVVYITAQTTAAEIAVIGSEGLVGLEMLLDEVAMPRWAVAQTSGSALAVRAEVLKEECSHAGELRDLLMRYMQALIAQMMQLAVCNRHHDVAQQMCRLLLSRLDRKAGDTVELSHEALAAALGTSRHYVTRIALDLWSSGAIEQHADHIRVLDRAALEAQACDCYPTVRRQYDRLLPGWCAGTRAALRPPAGASGKSMVAPELSVQAAAGPEVATLE